MTCRDCGAPAYTGMRGMVDGKPVSYCPDHFAMRWAVNAHERTQGWVRRDGVGLMFNGPLDGIQGAVSA